MERVIRKVKRSAQQAEDLAYWLARPVAERIAAVEALRQQAWAGQEGGDAEQRLQRVLSIARRPRR